MSKHSGLLTRRQFMQRENTILDVLQIRLAAVIRKFGPDVDLWAADFDFNGRVETVFTPQIGEDGKPTLTLPPKMTLRFIEQPLEDEAKLGIAEPESADAVAQ